MFHPQGPTFWELARQALSSTERGYDLLAPKFDYTPFRTPDLVLDPVFDWLARDQVQHQRTIEDGIDICCGTGAGLSRMVGLCSRRVVGLDFSQGMLDECRRQHKNDPRIELVHGDVFQMDYHNQFDLAVTFGALGHILPKDEERFLARVFAALKPQGRFLTVTTYLPPWWSPARILANGFNAAMVLRNLVVRPAFIMYYLTFLLPDIQVKMVRQGFRVELHPLWTGPLSPLLLVVATKP
jgi:SAM-dependent methyltransferase